MAWRTAARRLASASAAGAAFALGVAAVAATLGGDANAGVNAANAPATHERPVEQCTQVVCEVSPAGYAWRDGIRRGQQVVSVRSADEGGWEIVTRDAQGNEHTASATVHNEALRRSLPIAVGALFAGLVAMSLLRGWNRLVGVAAVVGVVLASSPLERHGDPYLSTAALGATVLLPAGWIAGRQRLWFLPGAVLLVAAAGLVVFWSLARLYGLPSYEGLEGIRSQVAFVVLAVVLVGHLIVPVVQREFGGLSPNQVVDLASLLAVAAGSVALVAIFRVSPLIVGVMLVVAILIYPRWRRTATVGVDRLLLSDLRERASIEATEEERARLARDIHDAPLQQLAGVIRQLELVPGVDHERDELRAVARNLRAVATDLRPPVLDDLGLAAALSFLADRATTEAIRVVADVREARDENGRTIEERAPAGVELAIFRIAEEAVNNAAYHSGGDEVVIEGRVGPDKVLVRIHDNGRGISQAALDAAGRSGRLGLASMRRRAALIGASFELSSNEGATIEVRWPR